MRKTRKSLAASVMIVAVIAIISAVVCVLAQKAVAGQVRPAITGGVAGACAVVAFVQLRRSG